MFTQAFETVGRMLGLGRSATAEEDDRRNWGRAACALQTTCRHAGRADAPEHPVHVENISSGGIGLVSDLAYTPGALVSIALPGDDEPIHVLACVVRCDAVEGGRYAIGGTFAGVLDDEDLARFGARQATPAADDQRQWVRYPVHARARFQLVRPPSPTDPADGRVRDISAGGISLEVDEPLAVGDLLSIDLSRDEEFVLTTLASVVRTERGPDGTQVIGCNFIRELEHNAVSRLL